MRWSLCIAGAVCCALLGAVWVPGVAGAAVVRPKWAVVSSAGTLVRGNGATSATRLGTGEYAVRFATAIAKCAYEATAGDPGVDALAAPVEVTVASLADVPSGLRLQSFDQSTGALTDAPIHVTIYCGARADFAVIGSDGTTARGSHVASSIRTQPGRYDVTFDHDVSKCAFTATLGSTGAGQVDDPGVITASNVASSVLVQILSRAGHPTDASFHLAVSCGTKQLTAVVRGNGNISRGENVVASERFAGIPHGAYQVIFDADVTACSYTATVGTGGHRRGVVRDPVTITTAALTTSASGVFLLVRNVSGELIDEPFHLTVTC